jgi:hypothetical protein
MDDDKKIETYGVQSVKNGKAKVSLFRPECGNDFDLTIDVGNAVTDSEVDEAVQKALKNLGYELTNPWADWSETEKQLYLRVKKDEAAIEAEAKGKTGYEAFRDSYRYAVLEQIYDSFDGRFDEFGHWESRGKKRLEDGKPFDCYDLEGVKRALAKGGNIIEDIASWFRGANHPDAYDFWGYSDSGSTDDVINDYFVYGTKD